MKPREFCREWFSASEEDEKAWGYRKKCVQLLADIIGLEVDTVERWGSGVEFAKMPPQYERTLAYAVSIKRMVEAAGSGDRKILDAVINVLRSRDDS